MTPTSAFQAACISYVCIPVIKLWDPKRLREEGVYLGFPFPREKSPCGGGMDGSKAEVGWHGRKLSVQLQMQARSRESEARCEP